MLAVTHVVAGAALGAAVGPRRALLPLALAAHALLDGVGHDDRSVGLLAQAALAGSAVGGLTYAWGVRSPVVAGALLSALPDAEIAIDQLVLRRARPRLLFPSHWQRRGRRGGHPYRFPGRELPVAAELAVAVAAGALLCAAGRRRGVLPGSRRGVRESP